MESLFRFAIARPANKVAADRPLTLARDSRFQRELTRARGHASPRGEVREVAQKFAATDRFVRAAMNLRLGIGYVTMAKEASDEMTPSDLKTAIERWFGMNLGALVASPDLQDDDERTADSLVAIKILSSEQRKADAVELANVIRQISLIRRLGDAELGSPEYWASERTRPLVLPTAIFPIPPDPQKSRGVLERGRPSRTDGEVHNLQAALNELMRLDVSAVVAEREAAPESRVPSPLLMRTGAIAALTAKTRATLEERGLDLTAIPLDRAVNAITADLLETSSTLIDTDRAVHRTQVGLVGRTPVTIKTDSPSTLPGPVLGSIPSSHGTVRPVGVADLLVVRQNLQRYEARDIAHVENVLKGESKRREHTRSVVTEQLTVSELERVREEERELDSTERFEMSRAANETISEDASMTTGITVSGSYGPTVEFEASAQGALEQARERSIATASNYSRDVTERSRKKITETVRELRSLRVVNTVAEKNEHAIENATGSEHVVGIYQWLEKVYEAQIFNYGLRALFDFIVPEPASFSIYAMQAGFADATQITRPRDFDITPGSITESNYPAMVRDWEVSGVQPPPEPFVTLTKTFRGGPDQRDKETLGMIVDSAELPIPDGYRAMTAVAVSEYGHWGASEDLGMTIHLNVGRRTFTWAAGAHGAAYSASLDAEVGTIATAIRTYRPSSFTTTVEISCQRTSRAMEKWRLETYAALLQGYQQMRSRYEEKLRALRAQAGVEIGGKNPALNREIERRELKKACIELLTAQHFDLFGAITSGADSLPQIDVGEAMLEGTYVRFFEHAFEWQNATYVFYPYFWGRRSTWIERNQYDDADPLFAAFLRAGAARVVVPVRPGFELAVDHFMQTGEIWQGAEPPPITGETYVPIVEEISEQVGAPGAEVAHGAPWRVAVPTSLVLLRAGRDLPRWRKDNTGNWIPDET